MAAHTTVPKFVSAPPLPLAPKVTPLEIVSVPPAATISDPVPLTSPEDQFNTALLATVRTVLSTPIVRVAVPWKVLLPIHCSTSNLPKRVDMLPVVLKFQLNVVLPVPPSFWRVPALIKLFVVAPETTRMLSVSACQKPPL